MDFGLRHLTEPPYIGWREYFMVKALSKATVKPTGIPFTREYFLPIFYLFIFLYQKMNSCQSPIIHGLTDLTGIHLFHELSLSFSLASPIEAQVPMTDDPWLMVPKFWSQTFIDHLSTCIMSERNLLVVQGNYLVVSRAFISTHYLVVNIAFISTQIWWIILMLKFCSQLLPHPETTKACTYLRQNS